MVAFGSWDSKVIDENVNEVHLCYWVVSVTLSKLEFHVPKDIYVNVPIWFL